jgi:hypothetical protein
MLCYGLALGLALIYCEEPPATPPADSYCAVYEPIRWHAGDTRKTKEQADRENAKWTRLCAKRQTGKR